MALEERDTVWWVKVPLKVSAIHTVCQELTGAFAEAVKPAKIILTVR